MNILILTIGTRGDVQPYVALGKGLRAAGHDVTICHAGEVTGISDMPMANRFPRSMPIANRSFHGRRIGPIRRP